MYPSIYKGPLKKYIAITLAIAGHGPGRNRLFASRPGGLAGRIVAAEARGFGVVAQTLSALPLAETLLGPLGMSATMDGPKKS